MISLEGATIDLTSTNFLIIRFSGYTHPVKLTAADAEIFRAINKARITEQATRNAQSPIKRAAKA